MRKREWGRKSGAKRWRKRENKREEERVVTIIRVKLERKSARERDGRKPVSTGRVCQWRQAGVRVCSVYGEFISLYVCLMHT